MIVLNELRPFQVIWEYWFETIDIEPDAIRLDPIYFMEAA